MTIFCAAYIGAHRRTREEQARKIEERVHPIRPAGDEAVEFAEGLLSPDVESAFIGIAGCELSDYQRGWDKEEDGCQQPQAQGRGTIVRRCRNPARTEDGSDVEEQHIPQAHLATQLRVCLARFRMQGLSWL